MRLLFALLILALPALTVAQQAEAPSPAAVDAPKADAPPLAAAATPTQTPTEQILSSFPTWAVSKAGAETTGQPEPTPAPAATPAAPAAAPAVPAAAPGRPEPPASPARPDKLWPKDTIPIFLQSCTGFHHELLAPCNCVITHLMVAMPHDEFLSESADNTLLHDTRYTAARKQCLGTPDKRDAAPAPTE